MKKIFSAWCLSVLLTGLLPLNSHIASAQSIPPAMIWWWWAERLQASWPPWLRQEWESVLSSWSGPGHAGGLVANGLGATDIITRGATAGLFLEFVKSCESPLL